jgi:hypothetical protein
MIRHAGSDFPATVPVLPLPVAMICASFRALLMTAIGTPSLLPA